MNQFRDYLRSFFIGLISITLLVSCGDDDEGGFSIVGSWVLSQEEVVGCNDTANNSSESKTCTETDCERLVFSADGTFSIEVVDPSFGSYEFNGSYSTSGNSLIAEGDTINYSVTASSLVLTDEAQSDGCVEIYTYTKE